MRKLDKEQPYEHIYPQGRVWYVQNGVEFDCNGNEVVTDSFACACGFVAKSAQGLKVHRRACQ